MDKLSRLRWQCRRGLLELDLMLEKYLASAYLTANDEEKARFAELLKLDDAELLALLMAEGKLEPQKKIAIGVNRITDKIRL
ncbi:Antitoxin CptB [Candidatus Methylobacter favarea]|uniref:FAD assembly factor SdhE n=1 Tax=Candidatus Methylobacter favarea TaxID=2707345 RepID=A0A8S0WJC5_9GAMM|nr:succinate dehydrogenase assembly factor 2 [Candidatus Methylobacter favarea]CAA9891214.1 Antitoxin CptB [Candidatus Methylobacter favarea]